MDKLISTLIEILKPENNNEDYIVIDPPKKTDFHKNAIKVFAKKNISSEGQSYLVEWFTNRLYTALAQNAYYINNDFNFEIVLQKQQAKYILIVRVESEVKVTANYYDFIVSFFGNQLSIQMNNTKGQPILSEELKFDLRFFDYINI